MKLVCSVEVVRHCVNLKARVAFKPIDRFSTPLLLRGPSKKQQAKRQKENAENASRPLSKKQTAKSKVPITKCEL